MPFLSYRFGSLAAMAVFEDKFRPDMEVCKSLQFCSLLDNLSYVGHLLTGLNDSSKVWIVLLLLVGMLWHRYCVCSEDWLLGKASVCSGPAVFLPQPRGGCTVEFFRYLGCLGDLLDFLNVWQCRMFSYALSQCLKTTGFLTESNYVCLYILSHTPGLKNGGSLKNPLECSAFGRGYLPLCM